MAANWEKNTTQHVQGSTEVSPNEMEYLYFPQLHSGDGVPVMPTHCCKTAGAFTYGGAAPNQTDDEEKRPDGNYNDSGDQRVHVFKEVVVVVIGNEHIGSNIA